MPAPIAKAYVDRLFAEKDLGEIYWVISVVEKERELPEEFWLFSRIYEWPPSSEGWQYYEGLSIEKFKRISDGLERFGLAEIAEMYRLGQRTWDGPTRATEVFAWLDVHADGIHDAIFRLIEQKKDRLAED
jgi:hypothetical protein